MGSEGQTLGKAIDQMLAALTSLDESSRETALVAVCRHLKIELRGEEIASVRPQSEVQPGPATNAGVIEPRSAAPMPRADIRSLKQEKNPKSAREMACIVAYYLSELAPVEERKDTIVTSDLEKYFKQAGYALPTKIPQVLIDSKASGYFDSVGRGEYKLNAVGHNLVVHTLPRRSD